MFDWNQFLSLSERLLEETSPGEENFRTAISRAYYTALNLSREKLEICCNSYEKSSQDSHRNIISCYSDSKREGRTIANFLNSLRKKRVESDYETKRTVSKLDAEQSISMSKSILQKLSNIDETFFN